MLRAVLAGNLFQRGAAYSIRGRSVIAAMLPGVLARLWPET